MSPQEFMAKWTELATGFRRRRVLVDGALLLDEVLTDFRLVARGHADELLNLRTAARESGYSADHLGRLVHEGKIPNAGRPHAPRIRRADLPRKPTLRPSLHQRMLVGVRSRHSRGLSFTSKEGAER